MVLLITLLFRNFEDILGGEGSQKFGLRFVDLELEFAESSATNSQAFLCLQMGSYEYQLPLVIFGLPSMDISSLPPGQQKYQNIG